MRWGTSCGRKIAKDSEEMFIHYWRMAFAFASGLAPYQSPKLQTLKVGGDRDNPLLVKDGDAADEISSLQEMMRESGLVPTKLIEGLVNKMNGEGNGHDA